MCVNVNTVLPSKDDFILYEKRDLPSIKTRGINENISGLFPISYSVNSLL